MKKDTVGIPFGFGGVVLLVIKPTQGDLDDKEGIRILEDILAVNRKAQLAVAVHDGKIVGEIGDEMRDVLIGPRMAGTNHFKERLLH